MVYLVGAGPGDEGLITLSAIEAIETADILVYDELANAEFLKRAKGRAEVVYVGKKAGVHSVPQDEICSLLVDYAKKGKRVCRLKGGDPFLFGRGGEEAEVLAQNGISFEVIPGVSSAISVPAYAGIPITQRGLTSGVAIFTGHEDPKKETSDLNWKSIARLKTTLVFLMGMENLPSIVDNLIRNGLDASTPVAVIHKGTTPCQKVATGMLRNIVEIVERKKLTAPSIIVVGKVVEMRETLGWFEKRPLFGKKIMVTRSRKQASKLVHGLQKLGANVLEFPTIEIVQNSEVLPQLDGAIKKLTRYDWIVFTSANGVEIFMERLKELNFDGRQLGNTKVCAIGPATKEKLEEYFINADLVPEKYVAESILDALKDKVKGKKVLLPRADIARDALPEGLKKHGAEVEVIDIYHTLPVIDSADKLKDLLASADIVTFTSSSTVTNLVKILGGNGSEQKLKIKAASIGPITTETAELHGLNVVCEAKEYTIPGLIEAIKEYLPHK